MYRCHLAFLPAVRSYLARLPHTLYIRPLSIELLPTISGAFSLILVSDLYSVSIR